MTVVTRFPPSPTGFMHIGNARTALFNWLFSRHHSGKFLLRIEDTDRKRYTKEAVEAIINGMKWLGLDWDEEPVSQFTRQERHIEIAHELVLMGKAYHCYCSPEDLDEMRKAAREEGRSAYYDRRWRGKSPADAPQGVKPVIRIKAPLEGQSLIDDKVQGTVKIDNRNLDDFIILRSDETPTYMLAVVVDDHDMGVTHVIRGDDHLNNAFRQNIIYDAMEWRKPVYAHLPLIHGPDGTKFSKRHGAESVEEYRLMGYLPEAMRNYLLRLGWSHGDDEIISTEQAIKWFGLEGLNKAAARFDFTKLENLNAHYIRESENKKLIDLITVILQEKHSLQITDTGLERISQAIEHLKQRARTTIQLADEAAFYFKKVPFDYDKGAQKALDSEAAETLNLILKNIESLEDFSTESIEQMCRDLAKEVKDGKLGEIAMPLRAALTGSDTSPPIFHAAFVLGKTETCHRIQAALDWLKTGAA